MHHRRPMRGCVAASPTISVLFLCLTLMACDGGGDGAAQASAATSSNNDAIAAHAEALLAEGRDTFRHDTFADEEFWGGTLQLHLAIAGEANGGVGPGLSPEQALGLGLKVDVEALPSNVRNALRKGTVDLEDPAVTLLLLREHAVVGVTGFFDAVGQIESVGIQCALCHSTVDDSFATGIGVRLDGWANRDLDVGKIILLAPDLSVFTTLLGVDVGTVAAVLNAWGPGKFDAELLLDGLGFNGENSAATLIPPAFGLAGVNLHTWTGWGSVTHWNAFVANLEMHGKGRFYDPRLNDADKFPIAAANGFGNIQIDPEEDRITPKLAALHFYQLAIPAPTPPEGSFDAAAAERGRDVFRDNGCQTCHVEPIFTEPGWNMHTPEEICVDSFQADRSPDGHYRTSPLAGLFSHHKGGFYHDGRFATLADVIHHYEDCFGFDLGEEDENDLIEYLKSL